MWGIFGPTSPEAAIHVQSICDAKEMPHIETRYDADTKSPMVNLHPHPSSLGKVFVDLVNAWNWKSFTILYENGPWLPQLSELLEMYDPKGYTITVRQLDLNTTAGYYPVLRRVKLSEDNNFILACSIESLPEILKQAQQVGILVDHYQVIITSLDLHIIDLEPYRYSGVNITGIRLYDPEDPNVITITDNIAASFKEKDEEVPDGLTADKMTVETVLTYDSVLLFYDALKQLKNNTQLKPAALKCDNDHHTWKNGLSLSNFMLTVSYIISIMMRY